MGARGCGVHAGMREAGGVGGDSLGEGGSRARVRGRWVALTAEGWLASMHWPSALVLTLLCALCARATAAHQQRPIREPRARRQRKTHLPIHSPAVPCCDLPPLCPRSLAAAAAPNPEEIDLGDLDDLGADADGAADDSAAAGAEGAGGAAAAAAAAAGEDQGGPEDDDFVDDDDEDNGGVGGDGGDPMFRRPDELMG